MIEHHVTPEQAAPLLALVFLVCAILSPHRSPRVALLAAAVMEVAVSMYAGAIWFLPLALSQ